MKFESLRSALLRIGVMALAAVSASAQSQPSHVGILQDGKTTVYLKPPAYKFPAAQPDAGLVTIYSNLGTGDNVYSGIAGTGILGHFVPNQPFPEWIGNSFVPSEDRMITEIQVGVSYVSGPQELVVTLNADNNGLPGDALAMFHSTSLPDFGTCCQLQTAKLSTGIPVTKGTTYWVVARTRLKNMGTWDVWNNDYNDFQGPTAVNHGHGWVDGGIQVQGAFGVFGQ
jgi:hypothetical protein